MKDETKQELKDTGWAIAAFLGDHPVFRGFIVGFLAGVLICWLA